MKRGDSNSIPAERLTLFLLILCAALILATQAVLFGLKIYGWRSASHAETLPDPTIWPEPIRMLSTAMQEEGLGPSQWEVYRFDVMPDEKAIIRLPDSDAAIDFLTRHLELSPAKTIRMSTQSDIDGLPDEWWIGKKGNARMWASRRYQEGEEADQYVVTRDEDQKRIFIYYYFNF
ncbi:hypothetical protein LOC68_17250 [Blastopirellula sp. JC732]|uniref:Uncharacterized protein n=1 Tax=Blastopirellula sediminis TaxID=2894196 RepID=A0A9X1MN06_9BACT|nr:hypothetical protein [Blastopirellula sediminis]MCC9606559.1 hypothetical protein [Blastopirellula sediminis]MCC9630143.1 hypothetical protein [Blastopirellula sediminis]